MAENYLFKQYGTEDYVRIAEEAARWIKGTEKITPHGKVWKQNPDSDDDLSDYPYLTDRAMYGGSAGIGLFYLRLYQVTKKVEYLDEAKAAASDIMANYEGRDFYINTLKNASGYHDKRVHVKNMPGWIIGHHNGPVGGGYLALKLYEVTKSDEYKEYAEKAADDLISVAKDTSLGIHWSEQSDVSGDAGFVLYLIAVWEASNNQKYLDAAKEAGRFILSKGIDAPSGGKYWRLVDMTIIDFPEDVFWVNFAHGTSGVGWVFAVLYKATKDEVFLNAAKDAAEYLIGIAVGDDNAVLVPYLDSLKRGPSTEFYYLSICHGPVGTSLVFEALYNITGDMKYLDFVRRLSRGIIRTGAPERFSRGYWGSHCLCCGTPGLMENFVAVYRLTGEHEFLDYAKRTADSIIGFSHVNDDGTNIYKTEKARRWFGNWWRTIPNDVHSYTGLYIGTAGNAWGLLSYVGAVKGERYVEIYERGNNY